MKFINEVNGLNEYYFKKMLIGLEIIQK